jgi:hypothetical protein
MKKLIATIMSLMVMTGFTACGNNDSSSDSKSKSKDSAVSDNDSESNDNETTPEADNSPITVDDVLNHPETPAEDFEYIPGNEYAPHVTIEKYTGTDPIVVIPEKIDGFPVTATTNFGDNVKGVSFPSGITELDGTFNNCDNIQIVIAKNVEKAGEYTFLNNPNLKYVDLGTVLTEISECQFISDVDLEIHIPESTTEIDCVMWEETTTIVGKAGSYAETYANENGISFKTE